MEKEIRIELLIQNLRYAVNIIFSLEYNIASLRYYLNKVVSRSKGVE